MMPLTFVFAIVYLILRITLGILWSYVVEGYQLLNENYSGINQSRSSITKLFTHQTFLCCHFFVSEQ